MIVKPEIIKDFIKINPYSRCGKSLKQITGIVVHWIGNAGTNARQNLAYFKGLVSQDLHDDIVDRYASTHFILDDNEIIQSLPLNEIGYHVGAYKYQSDIQEKIGMYPNAHTIGIEVCHEDWSGKFSDKAVEKLIDLIIYLMDKFKLSLHNLYRHYDITGKLCPKYYVENHNEWIDFLNLIHIRIDYLARR